MGKTLSQIVSDVRVDLRDTDPANQRWSDAALQRFVDRARLRVQEVMPRERTADLVAVAGARDYALSSIADLLWVERVAFDWSASRFPPNWTPFKVWNGVLTLLRDAAPAGGETIRLYYAGAHAVDGSGNTLPPEHEHLLAMGAAVYAGLEQSASAIGRFGSSEATPHDWQSWLNSRLQSWERAIGALRRAAGLRGVAHTATGWDEG